MPEHDPGGVELQTCIACGQTDNHPKHEVSPDMTTRIFHHYDCGARMSPPCGTTDVDVHPVCQVVHASEFTGSPGAEMRAHVEQVHAKAREEGVL